MRQALISIDQAINCMFFWWLPGGTWADETLSARAWRIRVDAPKVYRIIDALFFFEPNHCRGAFESERDREQLPVIYRETK